MLLRGTSVPAHLVELPSCGSEGRLGLRLASTLCPVVESLVHVQHFSIRHIIVPSQSRWCETGTFLRGWGFEMVEVAHAYTNSHSIYPRHGCLHYICIYSNSLLVSDSFSVITLHHRHRAYQQHHHIHNVYFGAFQYPLQPLNRCCR